MFISTSKVAIIAGVMGAVVAVGVGEYFLIKHLISKSRKEDDKGKDSSS